MKVLKLGSSGGSVLQLQEDLKHLGYSIDTDGIFGPRTEATVKKFQREYGLVEDGIVGPLTWKKLYLKIADEQSNAVWMPAARFYPLTLLADGRKPIVTSQHHLKNPSRPKHNGVDLFYKRAEKDPPMKIGDGGRTKGWWIPEKTYARASADGRVILAGWSATGYRVWLEHANGWKTGYFHMDKLAVEAGKVVAAGERIGRVNDNPKDTDPDHLHFEVYRGGLDTYPYGTQDPEIWLDGAHYFPF